MAIILKAGSQYASYRMTENVGFDKFWSRPNKMIVSEDTHITANGSDINGLVYFRFGDSPILYAAASGNVVSE
jgi:hypothetical protein